MSGLYPPLRPTAEDREARAGKTAYEVHAETNTQVKEYLIAVETVKIMQEKLKQCWLKSGPNHFEDCKELRETLWEKLNTPNYGAPGPARSVRSRRSPPKSFPEFFRRRVFRPLPPFFFLSMCSHRTDVSFSRALVQTSKYGIQAPIGGDEE